ncbi:hypothetical protein HPB51_012616 [Rhipicephalus microplus]|uniref:CCHC-type domain-containing protein n=1 Tax=Rhipicephalus microplus TaxID=6941 RepID=A0A9J6E122_RHIMP|nr:hypothetical protein HPB51_012616 [Rhipicephalus microplus]
MIRQIVREELGRRDAVNPPRAPAINTSPPYDAMCAAVDATLYDVPQSRAPEPPTDNLHHRRGFQNASRQPPTMVSSWDDHGHMASRGMFGDVREAPVCYNCGFRGHVARFCGQRRRPQQRYYEGPSPSSRQNRWRGGMHSMRDVYVGDGFQQTTHSDTHESIVRNRTPSPEPQHLVTTPVHRFSRRRLGLSPELLTESPLTNMAAPSTSVNLPPAQTTHLYQVTFETPRVPEVFRGEPYEDVDDWLNQFEQTAVVNR